MTTKGFFLALLVFFFSYTYVSASRLYTAASPPAQCLAFYRVRRQPPLPSLAPPSPIRPPSSAASADPGSWHSQFLVWRRVATAGATHHAQRGRRTRGERGVSAEATAEHTSQAQSRRRGQGERGASARAAEHTRRKAARERRQRGGDRGAPRAPSDGRGPAELPGPLTADAADGDRRHGCHRRVPGQPAHGSVPAAPSAHPHLRTAPTVELEPNTMQSASAECISSNVNCQPHECATIRKTNCFVITGWYSVYVGISILRIT